jgi:hypothetical protein
MLTSPEFIGLLVCTEIVQGLETAHFDLQC